VLSTIPDGYGYACGTSMAAPHATGVAALLASTYPDAGPEELATLLADSADPLPDEGHGFYGRGLVDALDAVTG
jgi:subtilisin family serine protease